MESNPVIDAMLQRKSIRKYQKKPVPDEVIAAVVRAGQQAPFAGQIYSVLLSRKKRNPFGAPLLFTICIDLHRLELIMARRKWTVISNDLSNLVFGFQDASLMAENMVMAGESLGLGSCFLGAWPSMADKIAKRYNLPPRVFPVVGLVMGYPAENPPPRPRYPLEFTLFEDTYPDLTDEMVAQAMKVMDEGYLAQGYYRKLRAIIPLEGEREETFTYDDYSWTEHISRKWGQWDPSPKHLLEQFAERGFKIGEE